MSRLQELEDQLNEIGLRLKPPEKSRSATLDNDRQTEPDRTSNSESVIRSRAEQGHAGLDDDVSVIRESAKAKALLAMRDELQPRPPMSNTMHIQFELSSRGLLEKNDILSNNSLEQSSCSTLAGIVDTVSRQQPGSHSPNKESRLNMEPWLPRAAPQPVLVATTPYVAPSLYLDSSIMLAGSAATWEGQKSAALLALEGERRQLQVKVEGLIKEQDKIYRQMQELVEKHCIESQAASDGFRQLQLEQSLRHQREVHLAAGLAGEKLEKMQVSAWQLFTRQRVTKLAACAFFIWHRSLVKTRKLAQALSLWERKILAVSMAVWMANASSIKTERESAALALDCECRRLTVLEARLEAKRLRRMILAWREALAGMVIKRNRHRRADQHWRCVAGRALMEALAVGVEHTNPAHQAMATGRLRRVCLVHCFKGWVQLHRLHHLYFRNLALRLIHHWHGFTEFSRGIRRKVGRLQASWRARRRTNVMLAWGQEAHARNMTKASEKYIFEANRARVCKDSVLNIRSLARHERFIRQMAYRRASGLLISWLGTAQREGRNRRVAAAHQAAAKAGVFRAVFQQWRILGEAVAKRKLREGLSEMQGHIVQLDHQVRDAELQRRAAGEAASALRLENRDLRVQAQARQVMLASDGLLSKQLRWRSLPADPSDPHQPAPRSRHVTFLLPALQGLNGSSEAGLVPSLSSTLVVFGGVGGETWYKDIQILTITQSVAGGSSASWQVPLVAENSDLRSLPYMRDFAGCACGPGQFLVFGGFDGCDELNSMHLFDMRRMDDGDGGGDGTAAFHLSWQVVQPRNHPPRPRSHHTATYDQSSRTLLVFGGYSSKGGGLLSELWAFNFDHMEWWQPETLGDQPPPRRGHIAAVIGGKLVVHGGFDGIEHLGDLWSLDLMSWHWNRPVIKGESPSGRRGHAADVVSDRLLLVHGGYDGTGLLSDGHVLDVAADAWSRLDAAGGSGPDDAPPAPRSHHTLTAVGHACVVLGGSGALGPLGLGASVLESPAVTAGLKQQHQLLEVRRELAESQLRAAGLQGHLGRAEIEREWQSEQRREAEQRSSMLTGRLDEAVSLVDELRGEVARAESEASASVEALRELELRAAGLQRRVDRARKGGRQVAVEAEVMYQELSGARSHIEMLEGSLAQAMAATHDAQSLALQLSGERQALQMQLAAGANEVAVLRQMVAAVEREHREAKQRIQEMANEEIASTKARMDVDFDAIKAEHAKAVREVTEAKAHSAGVALDLPDNRVQDGSATSRCVDGPPVTRSSSPSKHRYPQGPRSADLAGGMADSLLIEQLQRDYSAMADELSQARQEVSRESASHQATRRALADAAEDMKRLEFRYQRSIEQLEGELKHMQRSTWAKDLAMRDRESIPIRRQHVENPCEPQAESTHFRPDAEYPPIMLSPQLTSANIHGEQQPMPEFQELLRLREAILF